MHRKALTRSAGLLIAAAALTTPALADTPNPSPAAGSAETTTAPPNGTQTPPPANVAAEPEMPRLTEPKVVHGLPDQVRAEEVNQGEHAFGVATLIIGALLAVAIVVGLIVLLTRRTWSASS